MTKAPKGTVSIYVADNRLRLRWQSLDATGKPKRFSMAFGAVSQINRLAAEKLARSIEMDLASGNFDPSLQKYNRKLEQFNELTIVNLIDRFLKSEFDADQSSSLERYNVIRNHLIKCFGAVSANSIQEKSVRQFTDYLIRADLKGETINLYLTLLRSIWSWAVKRSLIGSNPWINASVRVDPTPQPEPFSQEEVLKIIREFEGTYYSDFVLFLLGTGCRIGEAIALHWDAVSKDCSEVWFGRSFDAIEKKVKTTKTNKARKVPVSPNIQQLLAQRRESSQAELVFPAPKGGYIDRRNFLNRQWKPLLESLGIPYRPPYKSRHTRWSHEIAEGMDIATAALYAGNRPRTMLNRYLGSVHRPRLKDWD